LAERYPGRVGWANLTLKEIHMPAVPARAAVRLFQRPELALNLLRHLRSKGVRRVGYLTAHSRRFKLRSIMRVMLVRITKAVASRLVGPETVNRITLVRSRRVAAPTVTDTLSADEETWTRALARIDWSGPPILRKSRDFVPGKVMIVTGSLGAGGSERQVVYTALGLQRLGVAPTVVTTRRDGPANFFGPRLESEEVKIIELPKVDLLATSECVHSFKTRVDAAVDGFDSFSDEIVRYADLFELKRPSIVHIWLDWPNCAAGLAALAVGVPRIVVSGRSLSPVHFNFLRSFMRPAYREMAKSPRVHFINNSQAGADDYAAWLGIEPSRIKVISNAVDADEHKLADPDCVRAFREKHRLPDGVPVLGAVFRMTPEKRPMLWLEIAERVAASLPETRFILVGGGPELSAVRVRAAELGLADKLIMTGETTDVATPLSVMSCFLLTSRVEGLPNVLLEAQLSGVPVVTSAVGGAPETIDADGRAGAAVAGDDPADYAKTVLAWLRDPARVRAARQCLPASVLHRFSRERMMDATLEAYGLDARPKPINPAL